MRLADSSTPGIGILPGTRLHVISNHLSGLQTKNKRTTGHRAKKKPELIGTADRDFAVNRGSFVLGWDFNDCPTTCALFHRSGPTASLTA